MGSFCGGGTLFGKQQNTEQTTSGSQSGQTSSNFLPQLQQAYGALQNQYSSLGDMGANQFQQQAAQNQTGTGANLAQGYSTASNIAQNGISPSSISQYMSPYIGSVVNAYNQQQDINDAQTLSQQQASAAKAGALTGSTNQGAEALLRNQLQTQRNSNTANLLNSGYSQAASLAGQSANAQLAGANSLGSLVGANTNANNSLGSLGTNLQQANLAPYTLASQYASGTSGLANSAGQSYTGQINQNSNQQTTQNPGIGSTAFGLAGLFGGLLKDGGRVDAPRMADGGDPWAATVERENPWETTVTPEPQQTMVQKVAKGLGGFKAPDGDFKPMSTNWLVPVGGGGQRMADGGVPGSIVDRYKKTLADVHAMHRSLGGAAPGMAFGGDPESPPEFRQEADTARMDLGAQRPQESHSLRGLLAQYLPGLNEGVYAGRDPTPNQRFGLGLMNVGMDGSNPFAGMSKQLLEQSNSEEQRRLQRDTLAQQLAQQAQIATGQIGGTPTLAARQFTEEQRQHDKPTWGVVGQNEIGQPVYGWINPNLAPNANMRNGSGQAIVPSGVSPGSSDAIMPGQPQNTLKMGDLNRTGEDFLATLDEPTARQIKAMVDGRTPPPSGFALQKPYWQHMMRLAGQYDPNFDMVNWQSRQKTRNDFTAGKSAQNITAFNTAIGHLGSLDKAVEGLQNGSYPLLNRVGNTVRENYDPKFASKLKEFETAKTAVVDELTRAFRGSGGNVHDIVTWEKNINAADSPEALKGAIRSAVELLRSRVEALGDTYNRGMGTTRDALELLNPKSRQTLERLEVGGRESHAPEQKGVKQGYATGPGIEKPAQDRLPEGGQPVVKEFRSKETGQLVPHRLVDGQWVPVQ